MPEITPEMIAAGRAALVRFNPDYEREADAAIRIFEAMTEARPKRRAQNYHGPQELLANMAHR